MVELTLKEYYCINEYLNDFIKLFDEKDNCLIADNKYHYTQKELLVLQKKIGCIPLSK